MSLASPHVYRGASVTVYSLSGKAPNLDPDTSYHLTEIHYGGRLSLEILSMIFYGSEVTTKGHGFGSFWWPR